MKKTSKWSPITKSTDWWHHADPSCVYHQLLEDGNLTQLWLLPPVGSSGAHVGGLWWCLLVVHVSNGASVLSVTVNVYPTSSWKVVYLGFVMKGSICLANGTQQILCWNITRLLYVFNIASAVEKLCAARLARPSLPAIDCRPVVFTCSDNNLAHRH